MSKFEVTVTVPEGLVAGDTFTIEVEAPAKVKGARGKLAGIALQDMTDDQLKVELINSKSVLYKATQRKAAQETIDANQARVDAALAEKALRTPVVIKATEPTEAEATDMPEVTEESNEDLAASI